jgi:hypothetical protein
MDGAVQVYDLVSLNSDREVMKIEIGLESFWGGRNSAVLATLGGVATCGRIVPNAN